MVSSVSKYAQKNAKQPRKMHDILPDEVEEFDSTIQHARKKLEIPVELAMLCVEQIRIPNAKEPSQKVAVSQEVVERPSALSAGRPCLTRREGRTSAFEPQRCIHHKRREHSPEGSRYKSKISFMASLYFGTHARAPPAKAMIIPAAKIALDNEWKISQKKTASVECVKRKKCTIRGKRSKS